MYFQLGKVEHMVEIFRKDQKISDSQKTPVQVFYLILFYFFLFVLFPWWETELFTRQVKVQNRDDI